jgi:hypothetical protein
MRKVVVYELLSLDGVAEEPMEFITDFDTVMRENLAASSPPRTPCSLGGGPTTTGPGTGRQVTTSRSPASSTVSRSSW